MWAYICGNSIVLCGSTVKHLSYFTDENVYMMAPDLDSGISIDFIFKESGLLFMKGVLNESRPLAEK